MVKKPLSSKLDTAEKEKVEQFRQDLETELHKAIDRHEFKMIYIGFATLFVFAGVIYLSVKFQFSF